MQVSKDSLCWELTLDILPHTHTYIYFMFLVQSYMHQTNGLSHSYIDHYGMVLQEIGSILPLTATQFVTLYKLLSFSVKWK